ncbi:MAG: hypothetical protein K9M98_07775 [Cephaloticoccus sp.]|nr:hypothetical protein [Cephaloticoccus sp.]MCF7760387.1 hypothetical protein [Cephaloticoccus sp.]
MVNRSSNMFSLSPTSCKRLVFLVMLSLGMALSSPAQERNRAQPSERAAEDLGKLQPFIDAKNWDGAITLLNSMLRYAAPNSYDQAFINDILSKLYLQKGDYGLSLVPMERAYQLGETFGYFEPKSQLERLYYLAQLFYQEATTTKIPSVQKDYFTRATNFIELWLKKNPAPTQDGRMFYVSLLYNRAIIDANNIDKALLKKTQEQVYEALSAELYPKEGFYVILLATLQTEGDLKKTADILELLVKQYPSKNSYWQQLMGTYSNLAVETKNPEAALEYNLRAIVTIERAQSLGFMNTPKDNYNLVGIYFNIGQFGKATELLYSGLRSGAIEQDIKKWELLAYSYLQINNEFKAIEVLKEATKTFPKAGQLDNQIAQIYYSLNQTNEAYKYLNQALAKGGLEKPGGVYYFKAYLCYELLKFEEALVAVDKAAEYEDAQDSQLPRLKQAIEDAIKERENGQKAKAA